MSTVTKISLSRVGIRHASNVLKLTQLVQVSLRSTTCFHAQVICNGNWHEACRAQGNLALATASLRIALALSLLASTRSLLGERNDQMVHLIVAMNTPLPGTLCGADAVRGRVDVALLFMLGGAGRWT